MHSISKLLSTRILKARYALAVLLSSVKNKLRVHVMQCKCYWAKTL